MECGRLQHGHRLELEGMSGLLAPDAAAAVAATQVQALENTTMQRSSQAAVTYIAYSVALIISHRGCAGVRVCGCSGEGGIE